MVSVIQEMIGILLLGIISMSASANEYTCTIKSTLKINQNGYFVKHGWAANYMNRQFTVDRDSGRVLQTTALKQRLSNADDVHSPVILGQGRTDVPFMVFTHYQDTGRYALLQIHDHDEFAGFDKKPFFYHTDVGMILTGTCIAGAA